MCGRRFFVVAMGFLGFLIAIGSREVFTMVIVHVISSNSSHTGGHTVNDSKGLFGYSIPWHYTRTDWKTAYVYRSQMIYFVGYILTQLPGGILAAKFSSIRVCGVTIMLTSLLTIAMRFALTYKIMFVYIIRFLQGIFEGPLVPALNGMVAAWAPKSEKTRIITFVYAGAYLSAAVASYVTGVLIKHVSFGSALFVYGGVGVLWSLFLMCCLYDNPASCPNLGEKERKLFGLDEHPIRGAGRRPTFKMIPWRGILTSLPLSAILVAAFCRNWIFALLITQIPQYYKEVWKLDANEIGWSSAIPHVAMTIVVISGGMLVDNLIKHQWLTTTQARKMAETVGFSVEAGCIFALAFIDSHPHAVIILTVGVAFSGFAISGYQVNPLDLAPQYVSVLTGIVRLGTIASVLSCVTVNAFDAGSGSPKEHWKKVFITAGSIHIAGVIYYLIFASGNRQSWAVDLGIDQKLPNVASDPSIEASIRSNRSYGSTHASSGYDSDESSDDTESLLTKSLYVERFADLSDEFVTPSWYMNTI